MRNRILKITSYLLVAVFTISTVTSSNVFAINDFYSQNNILFYDPQDTGCISSSSGLYISPSSKDNQEATAKFLTSATFIGNSSKPMNAVQMAAIMGNLQQESGFNPNAGAGESHRGIVQWESPGRWERIADPRTNLDNQFNFIKTELDTTYKGSLSEFWNASTPGDLNSATYAIARNYEVGVIGNGGSTSWTNNTDAVNNIQGWTKRIGYAKGFYDQFGNLAGSSGSIPGSGCGGLVSGGMTLEKAKSFMSEYKSQEPKNWASGTPGTIYAINGTNCAESSLANCVAFSQYFINRYTNKKYVNTSNGSGVVKDLIALGFINGGNVPKVYSIFSSSSSALGHTGVVLGIDKDKNKIIIGEAGCGSGLSWIDAREYDLSDFSGGKYTYAYTDGVLKGGL